MRSVSRRLIWKLESPFEIKNEEKPNMVMPGDYSEQEERHADKNDCLLHDNIIPTTISFKEGMQHRFNSCLGRNAGYVKIKLALCTKLLLWIEIWKPFKNSVHSYSRFVS